MKKRTHTILHQGDALEKLDLVKDRSVDLVLIDPPYILNTQGGDKFFRGRTNYLKEIEFISKGFDFRILDKLERKLKKVNFYIYCNKTLLIELIKYFTTRKDILLDVLVWHKTNPVPACNNNYLNDIEYILFVKQKGQKLGGTYHTKRKVYRSLTNKVDKAKYNHPTCKPVEQLRMFVQNSCPPGGVVLDCFMGSGSSGESALREGRSFIGIELDKKHFKTASDRIEAVKEEVAKEKRKKKSKKDPKLAKSGVKTEDSDDA